MQPNGSILELCQVVRDMDRALDHWTRVIKAGPFFVFDVPVLPGQIYRGEPTQVALKVAFGFSGGLLIELLQQTNEGPSVFTEMLDRSGEGYHHVMLRIPYEEGVQRLLAEGHGIAFSGTMPSGERFALFDTLAANGGFIELMELSVAMEASLQRMHAAHLEWDGISRPIRAIADLA
ncbi:VOC family protein [Novosphingobium sp.]|uniref:VOC family protein n=1 Tax=Novosphingobium sp. TaxID=1874826 RepID=UPI0025D0F195|nr:VOC family protein [Novosphingobium sp.]